MDRWRGRVALVTGASSGIGLALAESLAQHGMKVAACARNIAKIQELSERVSGTGGVVRAIRCDLAKEEDILAMFSAIKDEFGGVDVCINNAGLAGANSSLIDGSTEAYRNTLNVNVLGLTLCTREAVQSMRQRGIDDGHIIHISSVAAYNVTGIAAFYSATKFAVRALTEGLRQELRQLNSKIRVSSVSPGVVETEAVERYMGEEAAKQFYADNASLKPGDIVDAVIYELSAPPHVQVHDVIVRPVGKSAI